MNAADLIGKYIALRDKVALITAAYEDSLKPYKSAMVAIEGAVALEMDKLNVDQLKAQGVGTAFKKRTSSIKVADRELWMDFIFDGRREGFLTTHVSKDAVDEYIEQHKATPPGIDIAYIVKTQFRKGND